MDDGLILNLADDAGPSTSRASITKKGRKWQDRVKAKRVAKRKTRPEEVYANQQRTNSDADGPPVKRPRQERVTPANTTAGREERRFPPAARAPTQIISSLFTSNPRVEKPTESRLPKTQCRPSNAPLTDLSTFSGLGLNPLIASHLSSKMNISKPTSIQRAALPAILSTLAEEKSQRDIFIQSQTGSGKTLSFLLPIIQDLLPLSSLSYIDRSIGTLAIIIAPTRELAKQISDVLEALLKMRLRPEEESADSEDPSARLTRWLVSGLLTGGSTRTHEKARLRKGVPILVSTPGRLLDHLQNTSSFNVGKCRWLVLDEADRLMELGFEETIQGILKGLDGRYKLAKQAVDEGKSTEVGGWDWERTRRTVLCSATIREDVQKLAGTTLQNPIVIKATESDIPVSAADAGQSGSKPSDLALSQKFTPPSQLSQKYVIVPLKLRMVTLVALLRSLLAQSQNRRGAKIIVFLSCTDSVDFHWHLLGGTSMGDKEDEETAEKYGAESDGEEDVVEDKDKKDQKSASKKVNSGSVAEKVFVKSELLPGAGIFRLHGSLPLQTRLASLKAFSAVPSPKSPDMPPFSILLCTSVASRGLDLPLVRAVIQYDLPTEGGATEYVHRVGRTARVGKGGEAWSIVAPSESEWAQWVEAKMQGGVQDEETSKPTSLQSVSMELVLREGYGGKGREYEERATEVQLSFERWVLRNKQCADFARKAFKSHVRAYATHPSDEKHIFHVRHLHLGHLAKAFALREAPSNVSGVGSKGTKGPAKEQARHKRLSTGRSKAGIAADSDDDVDVGEAEMRMGHAVRAQGRLTKKGGKMVSTGASEFHVAGGYDLEKLMQGSGP